MKKERYSVLLEERFRKKFFEEAINKFKNQSNLARYLNNNIKERKIIRENIKEWIRGKHKYGWDILVPIIIIEALCKINNQSKAKVLLKAIKFNPPWKDPKKIKSLVKIKEITMKKINGKNHLDLSSVLPSTTLPSIRSKKRLPLFTKILDDRIKLWSEANWKVSKIRLKRYVELDSLFFIGSAIYSSEGITKIGNYNDIISLGNSEPSIINLYFRWLNSFLEGYNFSVTIEYNGRWCKSKDLIKFWKEKVHYIKNKEISIRQRKGYGSRLINNMGVLKIKISNTVLKSFIIHLINSAKTISLWEEDYSFSYLKGLLASEGSVSRPKLTQISIGCIEGDERMFIKKLLKKMKLRFTKGKNQLSITNWNNFFTLFLRDVFDIEQINSISKKTEFLKGLKNHQKTKGLLKLKKFDEKIFRAIDWQIEHKLKSYISAHKFLRKYVDEKILLVKKEKNIKFYYLNPIKKALLNSVWKIQELI